MCIELRLTVVSATLVAIMFAGNGSGTAEQPEQVDWWSVKREVVEQAFRRDIGRWARELAARPLPDDLGELARAFNVFVRAGHEKSVRRAIDQLATMQDRDEVHLLSQMADDLIGREDWDAALYFVKRIERAQPGWGYVLIRHWAKGSDADEIDSFLVKRQANDYWFTERVRFRDEAGTLDKLIEKLADQVREQPAKLEPVRRYIKAVLQAGINDHDIRWLTMICRPKTAYDKLKLARELRFVPAVAAIFLEQSLDTPYTEKDAAAMERHMSMSAIERPDPPSWEPMLRGWAKYDLMQAYKRIGAAKKAQKLLEELTAENPDGLGSLALSRMAGQIQAASGAQVVKGRILEAEEKNKHNSSYWRGRGEYFAGRKDRDKALQAYQKALETAVDVHEKLWAADCYSRYLEQVKGRPAAMDLLWKEYRAAEDEVHQDRLVRMMGVDFYRRHQEAFWKYLAARNSWEGPQRLIWNAAQEESKRGDVAAFWTRAEKLASVPDAPNRAKVLGWIMTRTQASARAIPLLRHAVEGLKDKDERRSAGFTLFEAYLETGDWRGAEGTWQLARRRLTPNETPQWLGDIAVCAARAGARDDSMRLWKTHANLDRGATGDLDDMIAAGMRTDLLAFYKQMKKNDPASTAPERAIALINALDQSEP